MTKSRQGKADEAVAPRCLIERYRDSLADTTAHLIFWPIVFVGTILDLWTKHLAFAKVELHSSVDVIPGFFSITPALNDGAAFGIAAGRLPLLVGIAALALVVILGVFLFGTAGQRLVQVALALFAAGVCGNLWDRLFNDGRVRDFIDIVYWPGRHWHTFNVADVFLCVAVGLLMIATLFTGWSCQTHDRPQKSER